MRLARLVVWCVLLGRTQSDDSCQPESQDKRLLQLTGADQEVMPMEEDVLKQAGATARHVQGGGGDVEGGEQHVNRRRRRRRRRLEKRAFDLQEGVQYIIRSKYPGQWKNAELSWDPGPSSSHMMASVEFQDPVSWTLEKVDGNWRIFVTDQTYPRKSLSWDGRNGNHPRASVECCDLVAWAFDHQGGNEYIIKSLYPGQWANAELSWDGVGDHPMASVEFHDRVLWEVLPKFEVGGHWISRGQIKGKTTFTLETGTESTNQWSSSNTYSSEVSATIGYQSAIGLSASASFSHTWGSSQAESSALSAHRISTESREYTEDAEQGDQLWQWVLSVKSNHIGHKYDAPVLTHVAQYARTGHLEEKPLCQPGMCKKMTRCQECRLDRVLTSL
jgi:hypothetical protein